VTTSVATESSPGLKMDKIVPSKSQSKKRGSIAELENEAIQSILKNNQKTGETSNTIK
jgi:hypothetical protein